MQRFGKRAAGAVAGLLVSATAVLVAPVAPAGAAEPGDSARFDTWTGYQVGRNPIEALAGDFDEDGSPDVAWVRNEFFEPSIAITLNLGEGTLDDPVAIPATDQSTDGTVANLNDDGNLDLVVVARGNGFDNETVDLYLGDGTGDFTRTTTTGGHAPNQVVAADLDADGDDDLAMTNTGVDQTVSVLINAGDGTFAAEATYPVSDGAYGIAASDIEGDGDLDLVVAANGADFSEFAVNRLVNAGDGTFTPAAPLTFGATGSQIVMDAADLDGDTDEDLFLGGFGELHFVLRNDGTGDYAAEPVRSAGFNSGDVELADLEGDGDVDAVSATYGSSFTGDVTVFRNAGDATFAPETLISSHQPIGLDLADFDIDGDVDIAAANRGSGLGVVHPGGPGGTFEQPAQQPLFAPPFKITTGDLDGDGDTDVAASVNGGSASTQVIQVLLNDGAGDLVPAESIPAGGLPESVDAADFDLDGDDDLVWQLLGGRFEEVGVALSNGDGTFGDANLIDVNECLPGQVTTADMDGDGDPDILIADESGQGFGTGCVQGQTVTILPSNGDGTFGAPDAVGVEFAPQQAIGADVDGDGLNDVVSAHPEGNGGDLSVALNLGGGDFAPHVEIDSGTGHREIDAADLDGDGDVDIAAVDFENTMTVFLNAGDGVTYTTTTYAGEAIGNLLNGVAVDIGDVNIDGFLDIAVANRSGNDVGVYFGNGDGSFDPLPLHYGMNADLSDLELADFDGDGLLDVAVPNTTAAVGAAATAGSRTASASASDSVTALAAAPNGVSVVLNDGNPECTVRGGSGDDNLTGTPLADIICTFAGNDTINGRGGNDVILTGAGNDRVLGGDGDDTVDVATGKDFVSGGNGNDVIMAVDGNDRLDGDAGRDRLTSGTGNDRLNGGAGVDTLVAGKGFDVLNGGRGHDRCNGGADRDESTECEVRRNIP
jgi:FG-GAP-like repeat/RTX calcium-binding nonapeptide repeat (4 copies)